MIMLPTRDSFAALLNSQFQLQYGGESLVIELTEVSKLRSSRHHEAFALVFRGPGGTMIPQSTYRLYHNALGAIDLFLVPIGRDADGLYYEAVISRLREEEPR